MADSTYPAEKIVNSRVPLDDLVEAGVEQLIQPSSEHKILVEPATGVCGLLCVARVGGRCRQRTKRGRCSLLLMRSARQPGAN